MRRKTASPYVDMGGGFGSGGYMTGGGMGNYPGGGNYAGGFLSPALDGRLNQLANRVEDLVGRCRLTLSNPS